MRDFRPGRNDRRSFGDREKPEMHSAVCDNCGKDCKVPFKPTSGKPIYCSDCFEKQGGGEGRSNRDDRGSSRSFRENRGGYDRERGGAPDIQEQLDRINEKLDRILRSL